MTLAELLAEARRLDEAATKGPWHAGRSDMVSYVLDDERPFKNVYGPSAPPDDVARAWGKRCISDAQFIAFARTALPRLARVAEAGVEMREAQKAYTFAMFESEPLFTGIEDALIRVEAAEAAFDAAASGEGK